MVGTTISHYKIIEKLGQGGMGEVFLAEDTKLERKVALKFLPEELEQDSTARKRFLREAKSAAALDHPYICHIHEVGEADGKSFISMEYVQGTTLREKLAEGPLALKEALQTATEIAEALGAAHKQKIVHRDLKPSNIMFTLDGHVKVTDFGLAKRVAPVEGQEEITTALTRQGATLGTVPYMSPEQIRGRAVDTRSDIFSFGVVFYEMLAGVNPLKKDSAMDTATAVLTETAPSLTRYREDIPALLQHTVKKMLAREPDQRYQLVHDVRTDLGELIVISGESEISAEVAAAPPTQRSSLGPVVAGGVMVLVLLALAWFWPFTPSTPGETIDSIAILPFENRSGEPELEYVSDGIAEGIIHRLSQLPSLDKVISSSSVRHYKGSEVDAQTVTREVDVRAVLIGSMTQLGDNIRISVELVDGQDNSTLWGSSYTRPRSAVYEIEEYLSKEIADALGIQLGSEEEERLIKRYTENSRAHETYLKGVFERAKGGGIEKAVRYFEEAIEEDPNYAPAYAKLAQIYGIPAAVAVLGITPGEASLRGEEMALKALELDPELGDAHSPLGLYKERIYGDLAGAERELELALELSPSSSDVHNAYARFLGRRGRFDDAIAMMRRAHQLDPLYLALRISAADLFILGRRYDEAIEQCQVAVGLNPNFPRAYEMLARANELRGLYEEAVAAYQKFLTLQGASGAEVGGLAEAYATSGQEGYWRWRLERGKRSDVRATELARIYAALGDTDLAIEQLEKVYDESGFAASVFVAVTNRPDWDPIRDDPLFQDFLRRMNIEP